METTPYDQIDLDSLNQAAESMNEQLREAGASSAEQAFGIGCVLALAPVLGIPLVLFSFKAINLILAIILGLMIAMALTGVIALIANQARRNAIRHTYQQNVENEIQLYLSAHDMDRQDFDELAAQTLADDAPLQRYLNHCLDQKEVVYKE